MACRVAKALLERASTGPRARNPTPAATAVPHSACRLAHSPFVSLFLALSRASRRYASEVRAALSEGGLLSSARGYASPGDDDGAATADTPPRSGDGVRIGARNAAKLAERLDELDDWLVGDGARGLFGVVYRHFRDRMARMSTPV